jgi:hypothetical protein
MKTTKKVSLNLTEINGNAFALMGAFSGQARREGWTREEIDAVIKECQSGDYDHLLQTLIAVTQSKAEGDE